MQQPGASPLNERTRRAGPPPAPKGRHLHSRVDGRCELRLSKTDPDAGPPSGADPNLSSADGPEGRIGARGFPTRGDAPNGTNLKHAAPCCCQRPRPCYNGPMSEGHKAVDRVLEVLKLFAERPTRYVRTANSESVFSFLWGLCFGCTACGVPCSWPKLIGFITEAQLARGWAPTGGRIGIEPQMRAKGMDEDAMLREHIAIYVAAFQRAAELASISD